MFRVLFLGLLLGCFEWFLGFLSIMFVEFLQPFTLPSGHQQASQLVVYFNDYSRLWKKTAPSKRSNNDAVLANTTKHDTVLKSFFMSDVVHELLLQTSMIWTQQLWVQSSLYTLTCQYKASKAGEMRGCCDSKRLTEYTSATSLPLSGLYSSESSWDCTSGFFRRPTWPCL